MTRFRRAEAYQRQIASLQQLCIGYLSWPLCCRYRRANGVAPALIPRAVLLRRRRQVISAARPERPTSPPPARMVVVPGGRVCGTGEPLPVFGKLGRTGARADSVKFLSAIAVLPGWPPGSGGMFVLAARSNSVPLGAGAGVPVVHSLAKADTSTTMVNVPSSAGNARRRTDGRRRLLRGASARGLQGDRLSRREASAVNSDPGVTGPPLGRQGERGKGWRGERQRYEQPEQENNALRHANRSSWG
jgi:hypothetical protein